MVFEIISPGNTLTEMSKKQLFYDRYGVEEYYLYDPDKNDASGGIIPFFFIRVTTNADLASIRAWMSVMDLEIWYKRRKSARNS